MQATNSDRSTRARPAGGGAGACGPASPLPLKAAPPSKSGSECDPLLSAGAPQTRPANQREHHLQCIIELVGLSPLSMVNLLNALNLLDLCLRFESHFGVQWSQVGSELAARWPNLELQPWRSAQKASDWNLPRSLRAD